MLEKRSYDCFPSAYIDFVNSLTLYINIQYRILRECNMENIISMFISSLKKSLKQYFFYISKERSFLLFDRLRSCFNF